MKYLKLLPLFAILLFANQAKAQTCIDSSAIDLTTICALVIDPVCGCDGNTYNNACEARYYNGLNSWRKGVCGTAADCFADFGYTESTLLVSFYDSSTAGSSIVSWMWEFGDGATSALQDPFHAYGMAGTYQVTLTIETADSCTSIVKKEITFEKPCEADFGFNINGDTVAFYDSSIAVGITQWHWDFGDGDTSILQNPAHNYGALGTYTVCMWFVESTFTYMCSDTVCKTVTLNPTPPCIDASIIDTTQNCPDVDPVCGCDNVTYQNDCVAQFHYGVTSWSTGACVTNIEPVGHFYSVNIYPIPSSDKLYINFDELSSERITIDLFDALGKKVAAIYTGNVIQNIEYNIADMPQGVYYLSISGDKGNTTKRIQVIR